MRLFTCWPCIHHAQNFLIAGMHDEIHLCHTQHMLAKDMCAEHDHHIATPLCLDGTELQG